MYYKLYLNEYGVIYCLSLCVNGIVAGERLTPMF